MSLSWEWEDGWLWLGAGPRSRLRQSALDPGSGCPLHCSLHWDSDDRYEWAPRLGAWASGSPRPHFFACVFLPSLANRHSLNVGCDCHDYCYPILMSHVKWFSCAISFNSHGRPSGKRYYSSFANEEVICSNHTNRKMVVLAHKPAMRPPAISSAPLFPFRVSFLGLRISHSLQDSLRSSIFWLGCTVWPTQALPGKAFLDYFFILWKYFCC